MPVGFVCVIQVILNLDQMLAVKELEDLKYVGKNKLAKEFLGKMTPGDINYVFFRYCSWRFFIYKFVKVAKQKKEKGRIMLMELTFYQSTRGFDN